LQVKKDKMVVGLVGLLGCWVVGLLAGWQVDLLGCWLVGCWARLKVGLLGCWLVGVLGCWQVGLLGCYSFTKSQYSLDKNQTFTAKFCILQTQKV
jgi:hypothetical protein